jgi:hypothetical protein
MITISGFVNFIILAVLVMLISVGLDRLFIHIVPFRLFYYAMRFPGVVLHEVAHIAGCLISGAEIKKIVLFSETGGSVTYAKPRIPLIGTVIISTAPLFVLPLILAGVTWIFGSYFGCYVPLAFPSGWDAGTGLYDMINGVITIFKTNLITHFNGWFLLYLYLIGSIILSLSPSGQDIKNAAVGIGILMALCLLVIGTGYQPGIALISLIISLMNNAFSVGLMFEIITVVVAIPFLAFYSTKGS